MKYIIVNYIDGTDNLAATMENFVKAKPGYRAISLSPGIGPHGPEMHRWTVLYGKEES